MKKLIIQELKLLRVIFIKINDNNFKKTFNKLLHHKFSYFINLTGYISKSNFLNFKIHDQINTFKTNVILPNLILSKIVNSMIKNNFGRIVNCSSIGIKFGGGSNTYNYSLSKFASEFIPIILKIGQKKMY